MPSIGMTNGTERYERTSVLREYASATERYAWTVGESERQRGHLPKHRYDELYLLVEAARNKCERLREQMNALSPEDRSRPL
jgi:hypothetical protein